MGTENIKTTESQPAAQELTAALQKSVGPILAQLFKKIKINQVRAESGSIADLDVDKVILGDATINKIILTGTSAKLKGAQAFLQNVRMVLQLKFTLQWKVDLGWLGSWDGTNDLGSLPFGMDLGNISIPSLANIDMNIPSMSVDNVKAQLSPINNLDLAGARIKKISARETEIPAEAFGLSGIGIGSASIKNLSVPKTATEAVSIEEFTPNAAVVLPGVELANVQIPSARVDNVNTGGFNFMAQASSRSIGADLGILAIKLIVTPIVHMDVGTMTIQDVVLAATASKLQVQDIQLPVTIRGINLKNMVLQTVDIGEIAM
ncbi:MAG: hypothetical protein M0P70_06910 [Desulfobulbaceae bacterium]|nr:hypothetical protein [Desulfobulbaceae bacterium]